MKKQLFIIGIGIILSLSFAAFASADFWAYFDKGERINYCNPLVKDRTAPNDGYALCMSSFNEAKRCYNQGNWIICNTLEQNYTQSIDDPIDFDLQAPDLIIKSPLSGLIYTQKSVRINISLDEEGSIYYFDNVKMNGWKMLCSSCSVYSQMKSFNEGFNNFTFRAVDAAGNDVNKTIAFFVDSKKPKIQKTRPKIEFASGIFDVEFKELNPTSLTLYYGVSGNYKTEAVDLKTCTSIKGNSDKFACEATAKQIKAFENQEIEYWFELTDIAGAMDESRHIKLDVDTIPPVFTMNYTIDRRTAIFSFKVTEKNFDEIGFYENASGKERYSPLCTRLKNESCSSKKSFSTGHHVLNIKAVDKAGNFMDKQIAFDI